MEAEVMNGAYVQWGKRAFDVAAVVVTAGIWLPLFVIVAIAVRIRVGSPIVFRQQRPGLNGRPFSLVKFRTMTNERAPGGGLLPDAARLTPFGRWLRSTSLDELPELWNVLKGEMSLVGPRPLLTQYLKRYSAGQLRRHEAVPGITGLAQVSGRNALDWENRLALDVWYVDHVSLALDLRILCMTIMSVATRRGISSGGHATMPEFVGNRHGGEE